MIPTHKHIAATCMVLLTIACSDLPQTSIQAPPSEQMLSRVVADVRGITMAVGDQETVDITAYNILGQPIVFDQNGENRPIVRFLTSDQTRIRINADQSFTALAATSGTSLVRVMAFVQYHGITKSDTIYVRINTTRLARPLAGISIQPRTGDSTTLSFGGSKVIQPIVYADDSSAVSSVFVYLDTDRRRARITPDDINVTTGSLTIRKKGSFWVYAHTRAYGTEFSDSVRWTGTEPISIAVSYSAFDLSNAVSSFRSKYLAPCGSIRVTNATNAVQDVLGPRPIVVEFEDPSLLGSCTGEGSGTATTDIGVLNAGQSATRVIPNVGTVRFSIYEQGTPNTLRQVHNVVVR